MGTTRIELRCEVKDKKSLSPLRLVYSHHGKRKYFPIKIKLHEWNWDQKEQCPVFWSDKKKLKKEYPEADTKQILTQKEANDINAELAGLRSRVVDLERRFEMDGIPYNAGTIIDELSTKRKKLKKEDRTSKELFYFIDKYLADHSGTRKSSSLSVYRSLRNSLQKYQEHSGNDVSFDKLDYNFFQSFQNFLLDVQGLNNTTVAKHLSTVKTFINYARKQGVKVTEQHKDFSIKKDRLEVIALTGEEFEKLFYMDLSGNPRLDAVRDAFCFSCATGLRYSDLKQLSRTHIKRDEIRLTIQKTGEPLTIPLTPFSKAILDKYKDYPSPLPVISNAKMNQRLNGKDVFDEKGKLIKHYPGLCELAGINDPVEVVRFRGAKREVKTYPKYELVTVHTARKTFCTLSLEKGMSAEEVMSISGHRDYRSFSRYVNITDKRKKVVMGKAWGEIKENNLKAI